MSNWNLGTCDKVVDSNDKDVSLDDDPHQSLACIQMKGLLVIKEALCLVLSSNIKY